MKLKNAARFADWDDTFDGYHGDKLFEAQFSSFESSAPDGSFQRRRTVSLAPELPPAPRRVVEVQGMKWIMGELVVDTFKNRPIRQTASAKEATDLFYLLTPAQAAVGEGLADSAYGHMNHLKDTVNSLTDSAYDSQYEVYFAVTEDILPGYFLQSRRAMLHVRSVHYASEGYWVATADDLTTTSEGIEIQVDATFAGQYDPITETYQTGVTVRGILLDMYKLYNFNTEADPRNQAGDMSLIVAKSSITPIAGQEVKINGEVWRNIRSTTYRDGWNIQLRRA